MLSPQNSKYPDNRLIKKTLQRAAAFCDKRKVGDVGPLGFRRSTDLGILLTCLERLIDKEIIVPGHTRFLDMGCADGRVNIFMGYLVKSSIGIELDEWTLDEYDSLLSELMPRLESEGLLPPPDNVALFHGDSSGKEIYLEIKQKTGVNFEEFDLFYTYLVMQEEFAQIIAEYGKKGAFFMVYGLHQILPKFKGLTLLEDISPLEGILAVYRKE
ncbi:hypothetical protein ACFL2O_08030 [Thermodesulfobacteriota bacterium]